MAQNAIKWNVFFGNYPKGELKRRILSKMAKFSLTCRSKYGCYDNIKWHAKSSTRVTWKKKNFWKNYAPPCTSEVWLQIFWFKCGVNLVWLILAFLVSHLWSSIVAGKRNHLLTWRVAWTACTQGRKQLNYPRKGNLFYNLTLIRNLTV